MNEIIERKIEWLFDLRVAELERGLAEHEMKDFLDQRDRIIADETVDEEIDKANLREETEDALGKDQLAGFRGDTL